jgi:hypothetical protein
MFPFLFPLISGQPYFSDLRVPKPYHISSILSESPAGGINDRPTTNPSSAGVVEQEICQRMS